MSILGDVNYDNNSIVEGTLYILSPLIKQNNLKLEGTLHILPQDTQEIPISNNVECSSSKGRHTFKTNNNKHYKDIAYYITFGILLYMVIRR